MEAEGSLAKRYCYPDGYCTYDAWYVWGRYVVLAGVIVVAIAVFLICACLTARRRRARGAQPYYGTGWMAGQHGTVNYYGNNSAQQQQQPTYGGSHQEYWGGAPPQYQSGQPNEYYRNNLQENVELQSPQPTHGNATGGDYVYQPPAGAPPAKEERYT